MWGQEAKEGIVYGHLPTPQGWILLSTMVEALTCYQILGRGLGPLDNGEAISAGLSI